ncbi:MAG: hypothetical protein JXR41_12065 [Bacteroidales bacterium]|nr:hypothetical protein [Bacteroidales bacterium]MBN2763820.1 hypothetical protein [Bacteroidales bacterium]
MKKLILTLIAASFAIISFAQPPSAFNYQAVIRDAEGNILAGQEVSIKIEILAGSESGTVAFRETHLVTTNDQGLVTLPVFGGDHDGMWIEIDWSADDYFIKIYLGNSTGTDFQEMGTSQLLSVPYAMHANTVATEKQELSVSGTEMSISGGNSVNLPETYENFTVTGTTKVGESGMIISEIKTITGTTDATNNSVAFDMPDGYTEENTHVLSVEIKKAVSSPTPSDYNYGLGYVGTNGTVGYRFGYSSLVPIGQSQYRMVIYYPDELKNLPFKVVLMKTGIRFIPI